MAVRGTLLEMPVEASESRPKSSTARTIIYDWRTLWQVGRHPRRFSRAEPAILRGAAASRAAPRRL